MRLKNISIGLFLSLCSAIFFFLVAEVTVRVLYPEIIPPTKYDWSPRHKGYTLGKPPKTFRIVVLGDSYTFGQGLYRDETFPKRLEVMLNELNAGTRFEVINLGFCGLNTIGELEMLAERGINPDTRQPDARYRGLVYRPDLILLEYTLNDASTSGRALEQIKEFDDKWRKGEVVLKVNSGPYSLPIPESIDKFLTINSRFYLFFLNRYNQFIAKLGLREGGDSAVKVIAGRYKDGTREWGGSRWALSAISLVAKENGLPVVIAVYPELVRLDAYPLKGVHNKILREAASLGFYTIDLFPAFEGEDAASLRVTPFDGHPNARAQEIAARAILEYIKKERLVPLG